MSDQWAEWGSDCELTVRIPARRPDRVYVYVAWGRHKRPLYVGKARNPWVRFGNHMGSKPWADEVQRLECHGFSTEEAALEAELEAILALNPIHNLVRGESRRMVEERMAWWQEHQAKKRADLLERQAVKAARSKAWAEAQALKRLAPPPEPKPKRVARVARAPVVSPHPRKRLRYIKWSDDVFTPDQLAIIARVQNRGKA